MTGATPGTDLEIALRGVAPETAELVRHIVDTVGELRDAATAPSTRKAYAADFGRFEQWCLGLGLPHLPAAPSVVVAYAAWMANPVGRRPFAVSTIERHLAAIAWHHRHAGHASPCDSDMLREVMAGTRRTLGTAPRRKRAASTDELRAACLVMGDRLIDTRDRAVLLGGYAGAFRRAELAALNLEHVAERRDGLVVTVARAKGDQEAKGRQVPIVYGQDPNTCPVRALRAWIARAQLAAGQPDEEGLPLFRRIDRHGNLLGRMAPRTVADIVKRHMAGLDLDAGDFAGHSLRRGMATTAACNGAPDRVIMATTRHASPDSLTPYLEDGRLFDDPASRYLDL